jgi:hypothetical protein
MRSARPQYTGQRRFVHPTELSPFNITEQAELAEMPRARAILDLTAAPRRFNLWRATVGVVSQVTDS